MSEKSGVEKSTPTTQANSWRAGSQSSKARIRFTTSGGEKSPKQKAMSDPNLSAPVYFLVREQAKSVVAIKELQEQMRSLEEFKTDVIHALCDIQHQLGSEDGASHPYSNADPNVPSTPTPYASCSYSSGQVMPVEKYVATRATQTPYSSTYKSPIPIAASPPDSHISITKKLDFNTPNSQVNANNGVISKQYTHSAAVQTSLVSSTIKDSKDVDSDKQDSGLDSDCRDHLTDTSHGLSVSGITKQSGDYQMDQSFGSKDELMFLLDAIGQRGIALKAKAEELERIKEQQLLKGASNGSPDYLEYLERERAALHEKLEEVGKDRDEMKQQLALQEKMSAELTNGLKELEYKLRIVMLEKQNMERVVQDMKIQIENESAAKAESWPIGDMYMNKHLLHDANTEAHKIIGQQASGVTSGHILSEENELQKLLARVLEMEDPVGRYRYFETGCGVTSQKSHAGVTKTSVLDILCLVGFYRMENSVLQNKVLRLESNLLEKNKQEERHRNEIAELKKENEKLAAKLEENKYEHAAVMSKVNVLERALHSVCQESSTGLSASAGKFLGNNPPPFYLLQPPAVQSHSLPPMHHWYQNDPFQTPVCGNFSNITPQAPDQTKQKFSRQNSFEDSVEFPRAVVAPNTQRSSTPIQMTTQGSNLNQGQMRWESQSRSSRGNGIISSVHKHMSPSYKATEGSRDMRIPDWETDSDVSQVSNVNDSFLVEGQMVGNREVDMDSIRSEFDPLTKEDPNNRIQDFVDSLDIPVKTTVTSDKNLCDKNPNSVKKNSTTHLESFRYCGIPRPSVGRMFDASSLKLSGSKKQSNIRHIQNILGHVGADKEPLL